MYIEVHHMYAVPMEAGRGFGIPWNRSYIGSEPPSRKETLSSVRIACALTSELSSQLLDETQWNTS